MALAEAGGGGSRPSDHPGQLRSCKHSAHEHTYKYSALEYEYTWLEYKYEYSRTHVYRLNTRRSSTSSLLQGLKYRVREAVFRYAWFLEAWPPNFLGEIKYLNDLLSNMELID